MEESPQPQCTTEALTGKLNELLTDSDNDAAVQFFFEEEMIEEVMQELYKEIASPKPPASPTPPLPSPSPSLSPSSQSSYSPNTKVEMPTEKEKESPLKGREDEGDFDEEWLARVLTWGAQGQGQVADTTSEWFF